MGKVIAYLWTLTPDRSEAGRPAGEHKIQMIVDGQKRGTQGVLEFEADATTVVLGYSPDFGVFVGWDARNYAQFGYSRNVQVPEVVLEEARKVGWFVAQPRPVQRGSEVRVGFSAGNLSSYLTLLKEADGRLLEGDERADFLAGPKEPPKKEVGTIPAVEEVRRRISATRIARDPAFAKDVKFQYAHRCAVCSTQLAIVEAAHIVPVSEPGGLDEKWNGICLCPNHHSLFDSKLLLVDEKLVVRVDINILTFLEQQGRAEGATKLLRKFKGKKIAQPAFWNVDLVSRKRMVQALGVRMAQAGPIA